MSASVADSTKPRLLKFPDSRRPESEALAEPLSLGSDHRDIGQFDLAPGLRGLFGHQVLDALHET